MSAPVRYTADLTGVDAAMLAGGFFVGWPDPPAPEVHLALLLGSAHVALAIDDEARQVVGFATALSDGVLCAYIPLLEVLPAYQGRGIGRALIQHLVARLRDLYMVDLVCDADLEAFYAPLGFVPGTAMMLRNYDRQSGA